MCYYSTSEEDVLQGREKMPLIRTNIYLDQQQLQRLRAKSQEDNLPVSELVRRAVDAYLAWNDPTYQPTQPQPQTSNAHSSPA
jgi:Ribbon-helix-helix domain